MRGEFIEVVTKLWDAWADDALVADRQSGVYIDPQKLRSIDHAGLDRVSVHVAQQCQPIAILIDQERLVAALEQVTGSAMRTIFLTSVIFLPLIVIASGASVWWKRR